jgi:hypothetical protein
VCTNYSNLFNNSFTLLNDYERENVPQPKETEPVYLEDSEASPNAHNNHLTSFGNVACKKVLPTKRKRDKLLQTEYSGPENKPSENIKITGSNPTQGMQTTEIKSSAALSDHATPLPDRMETEPLANAALLFKQALNEMKNKDVLNDLHFEKVITVLIRILIAVIMHPRKM